MPEFLRLSPPAEALQTLLRALSERGPAVETIDTSRALGRVLAADVRASQGQAGTALRVAVNNRNVAAADWLLAHGAAPDAHPPGEAPLLVVAARDGMGDLVDVLLRHGADPRAADDDGLTALHVAAGNGRADIVRRLLRVGVPADVRTRFGWTPLHLAAESMKPAAVEALLEMGADPEAPTLNGRTPWQLASGKGADTVHAVLRRYGGHPPR